MSEDQADRPVPTLEVRILRDGAVVERVLCEDDADASAVVQAWSDVEDVVVEVEDLTASAGRLGVLEPRPWEVDSDDLVHESAADSEEEER